MKIFHIRIAEERTFFIRFISSIGYLSPNQELWTLLSTNQYGGLKKNIYSKFDLLRILQNCNLQQDLVSFK